MAKRISNRDKIVQETINSEMEKKFSERIADMDRKIKRLEKENGDLKASQSILKENEERLQALMQNNPCPIFLKDDEGRYMYLNETYERQFTTVKDWYGKTDFDLWPKETAEMFRRNDSEALRSGQTQQFMEDSRDIYGKRYCWVSYKFPFMDSKRNRFVGGIAIDITNRVQIEEALRASERQYRELVENVNSVILRWDKDGLITFINTYGHTFFGYDADALIGKNVGILVPHQDSYGTDLTSLVQNITDRPEQYEANINENIRRDGSRVWMSWTNKAIFDENGALQEVLAIGSDITNTKRADETIKRSEMKLSQAQRIAHLGYYDMDAKTGVGHWSEEVYRIFGREPRDSETYESFLACVHPDDRQSIIEIADAQLRDPPNKIDIEYRVVRPDGTQRMIAERGEMVANQHNDQAYLIGTVLDITERKRMEDDLRRARDELEIRVKERTAELERQANLLNLAHDAIIVRDMDDKIIFWNHGAEDMYGFKRNEAIGRVIHELLQTRFSTLREDIKLKLVSGNWWEGELGYITKDNRDITVHSRQVIQKNEAGQSVAMMEINTDITATRQAEERLRHSQKMEAIGTLAGGIAHDFNNILAAILGFTEMAIEDVSDRPEVEKYLRNILKSSLRARDLVKQILAFSRKADYERHPVSMTPLIKESLQLLRASIAANIEIRLDIATTSDTVIASPIEVQQIVMNLVANAGLAMEEKGGILDIILTDIDFATDLSMMPQEYVQLTVKDTGVGMNPDVMRRVFEPFFTTRELDKGTGMGLAVVYGIVDDLGGIITVESKPGEGSIFRVNLPKVKEQPKSEHPPGVSPAEGKERILFVDDEQLLVDWAQTCLGRLGYSVKAVNSSAEALSVFSSDPGSFDLVITDQAMPGMTGTQLAKILLSVRPDTPIILCTGHSDTVSSEIAKASGIKEYLMKPLSRKELARAVRHVLDIL
ncbi:MAG: hybrid sensor histidine kinase/response regulator [Syntrophorhabdaceae bacterium]